MTEATHLYPVALNLTDRLCVVVGAGAVGTKRASGLLDCGARVRVVDPTPGEAARALAVELACEAFSPEHLTGAFLVVAATNDPLVNEAVARAARARNILFNAAGNSGDDTGDFATMASVRRGQLLIGVTTGGAGPSLSRQLRADLEAQFPAGWSEYVALIGDFRERFSHSLPQNRRVAALRALVDDPEVRALCLSGEIDDARLKAEAICR